LGLLGSKTYLEPRIDNRSELMGVVSVHMFKMAKLKQTSLLAFAKVSEDKHA